MWTAFYFSCMKATLDFATMELCFIFLLLGFHAKAVNKS